MGDLFQRVQDTIKGSINNGGNTIPFCSRATRVTTIGNTINLQDIVSYVDCDGKTNTVPYEEINANNGYINDCVQAGCSIKSVDEKSLNRYFVQFGTTDCNVENLSFTQCNTLTKYVVPPTGYKFELGVIYSMTLEGNVGGCFTFESTTSESPTITIRTVNGSVGACDECRRVIP